MLHVGTCPKCEHVISYARIESIELKIGRSTYKGISYLCPSCKSVLTISL
jgi:hypothetical protein